MQEVDWLTFRFFRYQKFLTFSPFLRRLRVWFCTSGLSSIDRRRLHEIHRTPRGRITFSRITVLDFYSALQVFTALAKARVRKDMDPEVLKSSQVRQINQPRHFLSSGDQRYFRSEREHM